MGKSIKEQLAQRIEGLEEITASVFEELVQATGANPDYLRRSLRQFEIRLDPLIEGVRQDTIGNLTRTLSRLSSLYDRQPKEARACVLESKRRARLALGRSPDDAWRKTVLLHLNVWLENPPVYPLWASLQTKSAVEP